MLGPEYWSSAVGKDWIAAVKVSREQLETIWSVKSLLSTFDVPAVCLYHDSCTKHGWIEREETKEKERKRKKKLATSSQFLLENICIYGGSWGPADRQASHSNTASSSDCETLKINRHNLLLLQTDSLSLSGLGESIKIFPPGQPRLLRLMLIYWLWWLIHLISYQTSDRPNWDVR